MMLSFDCPGCRRPLARKNDINGCAVECPFCRCTIAFPVSKAGAFYSAFSDEFKVRMSSEKYTSWARDLQVRELHALLWANAEYGYRASHVLDVVEKYGPAVMDPVWFARARLALEIIAQFADGRPVDLDSYLKQIADVVDAANKRPWTEREGGQADGHSEPRDFSSSAETHSTN
jgi:hypothetical protein